MSEQLSERQEIPVARSQGSMSNEKKWTPGPWKVDARPDGYGYACTELLPKDKWPLIVNVTCPPFAFGAVGAVIPFDYLSGRHEANAHLMAASPLLYDALEAVRDNYKDHDLGGEFGAETSAMIRAALAAARGER